MTKVKIADLFIGLTFFIAIFSISFAIQSQLEMNAIARTNTGYIREGAAAFSILEPIEVTRQQLCDNLSSGQLLYKYSQNMRELNLIALGSQTDYNLISGKQFRVEDLTGDGTVYYYAGTNGTAPGAGAVALGTLGIGTKGLLDYMCISIIDTKDITLMPGVYTVDGTSGMQESRDRLVSNLKPYAEPTDHVISRNYRLSVVSPFLHFVPLALASCSFFALWALTLHWVDTRTQFRGLLHVCGIPRCKVCMRLSQTYLWSAVKGVSIGAIAVLCFMRLSVIEFFLVFFLGIMAALLMTSALAVIVRHTNSKISIYEVR